MIHRIADWLSYHGNKMLALEIVGLIGIILFAGLVLYGLYLLFGVWYFYVSIMSFIGLILVAPELLFEETMITRSIQ